MLVAAWNNAAVAGSSEGRENESASGSVSPLSRHAHVSLATIGAVVAGVLYLFSASVTSPAFHLAREFELQSTYETFLDTGVPLVKPAGTGSWYTQIKDPPAELVPAVWDDDPGAYLVAAYVGRARGDPSPHDALRVATAVLVALPWLLLPITVARLFRRPSAGLATAAAPLVLLAIRGWGTLPGTDYGMTGRGVESPVYAIYGLASTWLLLGLTVLLLASTARVRPWLGAACVLGAGVGAGFGNLLRSWSGLGLAVAAGVFVVIAATGALRRRLALGVAAALLAVVLALATQKSVMAAVNRARTDVTHIAAGDVPEAHPTWHPLYLGLGYEGAFDGYRTPNPFGVRWDDGFAWKKARKIDPDVELNGAEYDRIIKGLFLEQVRSKPLAVIESYFAKLIDTLRQNLWMVLASATLLVWAAANDQRSRRALIVAAGIAAPSILYGLLPPVLVMPLRYYFVEFTAGITLVFTVALGAAASTAVRVLRRRSADRRVEPRAEHVSGSTWPRVAPIESH